MAGRQALGSDSQAARSSRQSGPVMQVGADHAWSILCNALEGAGASVFGGTVTREIRDVYRLSEP